MEDNSNSYNQPIQPSAFFAFDSPKGQSAYIKVIGVGGGGGNAVNHMFKEGIEGVDFIVCNTDMKALNASPVPNKIPLGSLGLGAGGKPEKARKAAEAKRDDICEALSHNTQMLFITAGMGGGTGTGAAPVVAEIARNIELHNEENERILVVAIVTRPFEFEGVERCQQAEAGIQELSKHVDSIIVINNEKLREFGNLTRSKAFAMADDVLLTATKGIAEIVTREGSVTRDFQDVKSVMENSGTALMGTGTGSGENRAKEAIQAATTSALLDDSDIHGAKSVLLYFSYSHEHEMTIDEMSTITDYVKNVTGGANKVLWGDCFDDSLGDELKVILIATGFEKNKFTVNEPTVFTLPEDIVIPQDTPRPGQAPAGTDEMTIVHKPEASPAMSSDAPTGSSGNRVVHVLEEEPVAAVSEQPVPQAPAGKYEDPMEANIKMLSAMPSSAAVAPEVKPVAMPAPGNVDGMVKKAIAGDNDIRLSEVQAERIRQIHELLRNNPNGPDIVANLGVYETADAALYEGNHSSVRESTSSLRPDGTIVRGGWLGEQPD